MTEADRIFAYFERWLRWHRFRQSWLWAQAGLVAGLGFSLVFVIVGLKQAALLPEEYLALTGLLSISGLALAAVIAYFWPVSRKRIAQFFDLKFGLQERLSTALEILIDPPDNNQTVDPVVKELNERQLTDTTQAAQQVDPGKFLPLQLNKWIALVGIIFVVGLVLLWINGEARFQAAHLRRETKALIAGEITKLEEIKQEIPSVESLSPEARQAIEEKLESAIDKLKTSETIEEAVSTLTQAEQELSALTDPVVDQTIQSLRQIGEQSEANSGPLSNIDEQMAHGDLAALASELSSLSISELSTEERAALAQSFDQLSQALEGKNQTLSDQLERTAEALREADSTNAEEAFEAVAEALDELSQGQMQNRAAQAAADQVAANAQAMLGQDQAGSGNGTGGTASNQGAPTSGDGQGSTASSSQSAQGGSSGAGRGEGGQEETSGSIAGNNPIGQDNSPGDGGESGFEQIYPPQRLGGESDLLVSIPGNEEEGQIISQGETAPGVTGPLSVPYYDIYPTYQEAYQKAINSGSIPPALRPLIRDYFSSLEPE